MSIASRFDASTIGLRGIDLCVVLARDDEPISTIDLAEMRAVIEEWYEPMSDRAFQVFAAAIKRKGWSRAKLLDATHEFLGRRFPHWTPGDFFGQEPRLYPARWYHQRVRENSENAGRIGWYRVEGCTEPLCGWIEEIGTALPTWEFAKNLPASSTPASSSQIAAEPVCRALPLDLELMKKLCLRESQIEDLQENVNRLERELAGARETIDDQAQALAELRAVLVSMQRSHAPAQHDRGTASEASNETLDGLDGQPENYWQLPVDIDAAEGPNARVVDTLFSGVRGRLVSIHRITMSLAFYRHLLRSVKPSAEPPQYVYSILYEVIADQQEDFLLWDVAGGLLAHEVRGAA